MWIDGARKGLSEFANVNFWVLLLLWGAGKVDGEENQFAGLHQELLSFVLGLFDDNISTQLELTLSFS